MLGDGVQDDGVAEPLELRDQASGVRLIVALGQPVRAEVLVGLVTDQHPVGRHEHGVRDRHRGVLDGVAAAYKHDVLCELNVIEQVMNVAQTTVVQDAWARKQKLTIHGWIYGLKDGLMHDLGITVDQPGDLVPRYQAALLALEGKNMSTNPQ